MRYNHEWERRKFLLSINRPDGTVGTVEVDGIAMSKVEIGLHFAHQFGVDVTHIPSRKRIGGFTTLGAAMEFAARIAYLMDWSKIPVGFDPGVVKQVHDLRVTLEAGATKPRDITGSSEAVFEERHL